MSEQYERITCQEVEVGDYIARAKTHRFNAVEAIDEGPVSRRLHFTSTGRGYNIRPRRDAKLWRLVEGSIQETAAKRRDETEAEIAAEDQQELHDAEPVEGELAR